LPLALITKQLKNECAIEWPILMKRRIATSHVNRSLLDWDWQKPRDQRFQQFVHRLIAGLAGNLICQGLLYSYQSCISIL
jgi:hypothetical protein